MFSTKYFDEETSLYYYGYRYYDPNLGRWLNRDPIQENGSLNIYLFSENSPIFLYDYLGLKIYTSPEQLLGDGFNNIYIALGEIKDDILSAISCLSLAGAEAGLWGIGLGVDTLQSINDLVSEMPAGSSWNFPPSYPFLIPLPNGTVIIVDIGVILNAIE